MDYSDTTIQHLYDQCGSSYYSTPPPSPEMRATSWVEAENIQAAYAILIKWFGYMQRGQADLKYPDPKFVTPLGWKPLTQELADLLIKEIAEDYEIEHARFPGGRGPGFDRLLPHSRLALAQELMLVLKSEKEINEEAKQRLAAGEILPPQKPEEGIPE